MNRPESESTWTAESSHAAGSEHTIQPDGHKPYEPDGTTSGQEAGGASPRRHQTTVRRRLADDRAPWRVQMQVTGTVLLAIVVVAVVALFYLNVSAKTAALGRQIQFMTVRLEGPHRFGSEDPEGTVRPIEEIDIRIAGLRAQLAELNSLERMEERAREMGFKPLGAESIVFLKIPGYKPRTDVSLAPAPAPQVVMGSSVLPTYRTSLIDELGQAWNTLMDDVMAAVIESEAVKP